MIENELENTRITQTKDLDRIEQLKLWFRYEYPKRLLTVNRYAYLGLPLPETRYTVELEAYNKENELRALEGREPLPELRFKELI